MSEHVCAVAIMAKASVAGTVKTRLVPPLSHEEAAEFNTSCLTDVATNIVAAAAQAPIQGFAAYHPIGSEQFFEEVLLDGFKLLPPREPRIGRSLFHAARDLLTAGYGSVCLLNADSPTLPTSLLVEAVRRLQEPGDRVVLGPAADGGYYSIGLKHFHSRLFEAIDWSTERVYRQTMTRAARSASRSFRCPSGMMSMTRGSWPCSRASCCAIRMRSAPIAAAMRRPTRPPSSQGSPRQTAPCGT